MDLSKDESIRWMNALNNAATLISNWIFGCENKEDYILVANWIYNLTPTMSETWIKEKISSISSKEELKAIKPTIEETKDVALYAKFNKKAIELSKE